MLLVSHPQEEFAYKLHGIIYFTPNDTIIESKCGFKYSPVKVQSGISFHQLPHSCSLTTHKYMIQGHLSSTLSDDHGEFHQLDTFLTEALKNLNGSFQIPATQLRPDKLPAFNLSDNHDLQSLLNDQDIIGKLDTM